MEKKNVRNAALNTIKQLFSIIYPLITFPYVSRVLGVSNYGKYTFANSIVGYFALFAALGITTYASREGVKYRDSRTKISTFSSEVYSINLISTIFSYILLLLCILCFKSLDDYKWLILAQSFSIILTTIGTDWLNVIYEDYTVITKRFIIFHVIAIILMFIFVKTKEDYLNYALISVFASAGANILNIWYLKKYADIKFTVKMNLRKHLAPIMYLFGSVMAATIYTNSDITLIGFFMDDSSVGLYNMSARLYTIVRQLLAALLISFVPHLSYLYAKKEFVKFRTSLDNLLSTVLTILLPSCVGLFMLAGDIIVVIGGEEYVSATLSLKILSISLFGAVLAGYYTTDILLPSGNEKKYFWITIFSAVINVLLNFVFIPIWGICGASFTTVLSEWFVFAFSSYRTRKIFKSSSMCRVLISSIAGCFSIIFISLLCRNILNIYVRVIATVIFSILFYFVLSNMLKNPAVKQMILLIKNKTKHCD